MLCAGGNVVNIISRVAAFFDFDCRTGQRLNPNLKAILIVGTFDLLSRFYFCSHILICSGVRLCVFPASAIGEEISIETFNVNLFLKGEGNAFEIRKPQAVNFLFNIGRKHKIVAPVLWLEMLPGLRINRGKIFILPGYLPASDVIN
jgi:hypothetical protein